MLLYDVNKNHQKLSLNYWCFLPLHNKITGLFNQSTIVEILQRTPSYSNYKSSIRNKYRKKTKKKEIKADFNHKKLLSLPIIIQKTTNMKTFTSKFQLSKTLRFELRPIGTTLENIKKKGLVTEDQKRAISYKKMKKSIDDYHKYFIGLALGNLKLSHLKDFTRFYFEKNIEKKKSESYKKGFEKTQTALRKEIAKSFREGDAKTIFSKINKKELFTQLLVDWKKENKDFYLDEEFEKFTTYFAGFNTNRANMYSHEAKATAIAYRLVHENLPKFLDNYKIFEKIKTIPEFHKKLGELYKNIEEYLNISKIDEAFELDYFNETLTQQGIDVYNLIIGGKTAKDLTKKIQGLNEYINLYNQKREKKNRIPKLKPLYKQILSDRVNISFLPDKFANSNEVLEAIENFYKSNLLENQLSETNETENILSELKSLVQNLDSYDKSKIYIQNKSINHISKMVFSDWHLVKAALEFHFMEGLIIPKKGITKKQEKDKEKYLEQSYYSIEEIDEAVSIYKEQDEKLKKLPKEDLSILTYFKNHFFTKNNNNKNKEIDLIANIEDKYRCIKGILSTNYPKDKDLKSNGNIDAVNLKLFLDSIMEFMYFTKPLYLEKDSLLEKDEHFYTAFTTWYEQLQLLIPLYNKTRNYITQKPYSVEKFKLNFENSTLLKGWDVNKEEANTAVLFIKEGLYYLGIMDKKHNKIFREIPRIDGENIYQKVNYKLLPGANKMLPKVFFSKTNSAFYAPNEKIQTIRNHSTHTKNGTPQKGYQKQEFNINDCRAMIDFFKNSIEKHPDWSKFKFHFSATNNYNSIDDFYREVEEQGYKISYINVDTEYIHQLIDEGKLYLFQIYNKDFSPHSKGKPNLHTMYFKALFDETNLKDVVYKLNGEAEIFYREKSISYDKKKMEQGHHYNQLKDKFSYPIIKDRRYTEDKFLFHVPITLNFKAQGNNYINQEVLTYLKDNPDVNIIGLDRGERHLVYLSLINQKGEVIKDTNGNPIQYSLNKIGRDYQELLHQREKSRDKARKDWTEIQNIKDLKEGYISQVVHKIAQLMVEYNAIVVMEDLNFGFKRGRFKVEKQVYQKLEKMLIDKLNYLVFKEKKTGELGSLYNALQLTNKFESFEKLGKQSGFLFYVPAWNTSKIDPTTGFVNLFRTKYETKDKARDFFGKFQGIKFNAAEKYFEFKFDYDDFTERATGTQTQWTVCTYGNRIENFRNSEHNNEWESKEIQLTEKFIEFFTENSIDYQSNLQAQIIAKDDAKFYKNLLHLLKLTLQMRNSIINSSTDYLVSPVKNADGYFFNSDNANENLPKDADANGAYHIAKKGLWMLEQINKYDQDDNWKNLKLAISNKEWLSFVQDK